jgi:hypothetical protein
MTATLITVLVGFGILSILVLLASTRKQAGQIASLDDFEARWQKVDLAAFMNLADPVEERYLQRNLPSGEFRRLQRERVSVMWEYLSRVAENTKLMVQAGQIVQHSAVGEGAAKAQKLVATAMRTRMLIFAAEGYLAARYVLPGTAEPIHGLLRRYEGLTQSFAQTWTEHKLMSASTDAMYVN